MKQEIKNRYKHAFKLSVANKDNLLENGLIDWDLVYVDCYLAYIFRLGDQQARTEFDELFKQMIAEHQIETVMDLALNSLRA